MDGEQGFIESIKEKEREVQVRLELEEKRIAQEKKEREKKEAEYKYTLILNNIESAKKNIQIFTEQVEKHRAELIDLEVMKRQTEDLLGM